MLEYQTAVAMTFLQILKHCSAAGFGTATVGVNDIETLFQVANSPHKIDRINGDLVLSLIETS